MTATGIRLRAKLPEGRDNGLAVPELTELRNDPHVVYVVAMLEPVVFTENLENDVAAITLGVSAVEVLDAEAGRRLLSARFQNRTGMVELDLDGPPAGVDPDTGELIGDPFLLDTVAEAAAEAATEAGLDVSVRKAGSR
jgi:hypothetical protein